MEEKEKTTYKILRFYRDIETEDKPETIKTGLTLEEAKTHCRSKKSRGDGWFDGFTEE